MDQQIKNPYPLYIGTVSYHELYVAIPKNFTGYAMAECRDANYFTRWPDDKKILASAGDKLQQLELFNRHHFFRFEQQDDQTYRMLSDLPAQGPHTAPEPLEFFRDRTSSIFLWGRRLGDQGYYESVIPKIFEYPAPESMDENSDRLKLTVREFTDQLGNVVFHKFESLTAVSKN